MQQPLYYEELSNSTLLPTHCFFRICILPTRKMGEQQNIMTQAQRGFVGLQDHPMESSLSRCRRRNHSATSGHYEPVPMPDQPHGCHKPGEGSEDCMPYTAVQQSNSWPSRNTMENIPPSSRIPPGISRPPFGSTPDKAMLMCRYMKAADNRGSVPLHHMPANTAPGAMNPMWGPSSGTAMYPPQDGPPQNNYIYPPGHMPPNMRPPPQAMMPMQPPHHQQFDILQDAMRQTIDANSGMPMAMPFTQAQRLGDHTLHSLQNAASDALSRMHPADFSIPSMPQPLPPTTWQNPINPHAMVKPSNHLNSAPFQNDRNLLLENYSQSNLSVNNYDPNSSECDYDDNGPDDKMDFSSCDTGENPEDLVIEIDLSKKPETLQDAIAMYIDFLILENDKKTHISECQLLPVRFDFEKEQYYMEVMSKPIPFPTSKFRSWLKLYNVDIEITDPHGNTASQTTFAPAGQSGEAARQPLPTHIMNWQIMPPDSTSIIPGAVNKCNPDTGMSSIDLGAINLNIAVTPAGNTSNGIRQIVNHEQQQQQNQQEPPPQLQQGRPGGPHGNTAPNVRVSVGIQCNDDVEQQIQMAYVTQCPGEVSQAAQLQQLADSARNGPACGHMNIPRMEGNNLGQISAYNTQSATCVVEVNSTEASAGRVKQQDESYVTMSDAQQHPSGRPNPIDRSASGNMQQSAISSMKLATERGFISGHVVPASRENSASCDISSVTTGTATKNARGAMCRSAATATCEDGMTKTIDLDLSSTSHQPKTLQQQLQQQQQDQQQRWNNAICIVPISEGDTMMPDTKAVTSTCQSRPTRITRSSAISGKQEEGKKRPISTETVTQTSKRTRQSQKQSPTRALP